MAQVMLSFREERVGERMCPAIARRTMMVSQGNWVKHRDRQADVAPD